MSRGCPGTLLGGTPYNISAMPVAIVSVLPGAVRVQCLRTAPQMRGSAGTMSPHCPPDEWQHGDNALGSSKTLYPHYPGQYGDIVWGNP